MTLDVSYHPEAAAELRAGVTWYAERSSGLGLHFETEVESVVDGLLLWPESAAVWPGWDTIPVVRSVRVPDYPYRIVYLGGSEELVIVAVAHQSRKPGYWRDRLAAN